VWLRHWQSAILKLFCFFFSVLSKMKVAVICAIVACVVALAWAEQIAPRELLPSFVTFYTSALELLLLTYLLVFCC